MRTDTARTVRVEISANAVPMDEALTNLARVIAAGMYAEEQKKKEQKP